MEQRVLWASVPVSAASDVLVPQFGWSMPDRYGVDVNHNGIIDLPNSAAYANPRGFHVTLDATATQSNVRIRRYEWTLAGVGLPRPMVLRSAKAILNTPPLPQGTYTATLTTTDANGVVASTSQTVTVRDYLVVALGDSYGSGEGDPERPSTNAALVKWADGVSPGMTLQNREAHRSSRCYSSQAALALEQSDPHTSVTYVNLCVSGATISHGLLGPSTGVNGATLRGELAQLRSIVGRRTIDSLVLSIGGNDFGFSDLLADLLVQNLTGQPTQTQIETQAQQNLAGLSSAVGQLAPALSGFSIAHTYLTAYPDLTQVAPGQYASFATDVLPGGTGISAASAQFASQQLLAPLDAALAQAASTYGWTDVDGYLGDFLSHGYAASDPWFRTMTAAEQTQGRDDPTPLGAFSRGAFHPNPAGHADEATYLLAAVQGGLSSA